MSAILCGKRSNFFEESPSSPPVSKRIRCSSYSPPRNSYSPLDHLVALFPDMDKQLLEKTLESSGNDLDFAIKSLNELRLSASTSEPEIPKDRGAEFSTEGAIADNGGSSLPEEQSSGRNLLMSGAEWVELIIREVGSASNIEDAKVRVARALEALEKSIRAGVTADTVQSSQENIMLKQQLEAVIQENNILKRAVSIQHERQKEFEEKGQELHQLKQLVSQYQEQVRTLEVNNYALSMHLKQAQQNNSMPGRFFPDVF